MPAISSITAWDNLTIEERKAYETKAEDVLKVEAPKDLTGDPGKQVDIVNLRNTDLNIPAYETTTGADGIKVFKKTTDPTENIAIYGFIDPDRGWDHITIKKGEVKVVDVSPTMLIATETPIAYFRDVIYLPKNKTIEITLKVYPAAAVTRRIIFLGKRAMTAGEILG